MIFGELKLFVSDHIDSSPDPETEIFSGVYSFRFMGVDDSKQQRILGPRALRSPDIRSAPELVGS